MNRHVHVIKGGKRRRELDTCASSLALKIRTTERTLPNSECKMASFMDIDAAKCGGNLPRAYHCGELGHRSRTDFDVHQMMADDREQLLEDLPQGRSERKSGGSGFLISKSRNRVLTNKTLPYTLLYPLQAT